MNKKAFHHLLFLALSRFPLLSFSQNVGIGTTAPGGKLHLKGTSDISQLIIDANATQNNTNPLIKLRNSAGTVLMGIHSDHITNIFMGLNAGGMNVAGTKTGVNNTFVGRGAGAVNTLGASNTAYGSNALFFNTTASQNTAIGLSALRTQSYDPGGFWVSANVAVGYEALFSNQPTLATNGISNTAIGHSALHSNTTGFDNTAVGATSLYSNTTGIGNTAIGQAALYSNTTGIGNTAIGDLADVSVGTIVLATAIGANTVVNATAKVRIGNSAVTVVEGQVAYSYPSDGRFKEHIEDDVQGLDFILQLRPVSYNFNRLKYAQHIKEHLTPDREKSLIEKSQYRSVGFIAQDVEKTIQETGFVAFDAVHAPTNETDNYSMGYAQFVVPLVKTVQELNVMNEAQDVILSTNALVIEELKQQNAILIQRIERLELLLEANAK